MIKSLLIERLKGSVKASITTRISISTLKNKGMSTMEQI